MARNNVWFKNHFNYILKPNKTCGNCIHIGIKYLETTCLLGNFETDENATCDQFKDLDGEGEI